MNFKHPEILYFLFLLLVPILVHLFQLRRFKTVYFTNVKFLKTLSIQTRKSSKIKKWLLLATRLLLLLFLILAFAQPFSKAVTNNNANNELYIVLDNSFSMQAKGKKGELLQRAIQDLLENVPDNQQFSLITNSDNYWNTDIKSIQKDLQMLNYSGTPFVFDNLISKINAHKTIFNKDIVVITDGIGIQQNQLKCINKKDKYYFVIPKAEQTNNVAIDSVYMLQNLENFYEIGFKLSNYNKDKVSVPIALYNDNKLIAKTNVVIENKETAVQFTISKNDFHGYAAIEDNGLEYDNKLFFSISKPKKTAVLAIGETAKSNFLNRIYTTDVFDFQNFEISALDYNLLEKQDAIVLNELDNIPQALQTTLKSFVEKGGNLIFIPSTACSLENNNAFLRNFGSAQYTALQSNTEKLITKINFSHPVFEGVFQKTTDNFQYPNCKSAFVFQSAFAPILSFQDQTPFLLAIENPIASVYVFAAPINKSSSNFQNAPLIVPTFFNMAQSKQNAAIDNKTIGDNKPILVDVLLAKDQILNVKNEKENFIPTQQILNDKVKLNFNDYPQNAGNFKIQNKENFIKNISFNYSRTESNLKIENASIFSNYNVVNDIESVFNAIHSDKTDSQIWKIFVILALFCLIAEIFIQKFVP
jgi:Aerotolerance regulator N-terminal